jgi:hypothetical protein
MTSPAGYPLRRSPAGQGGTETGAWLPPTGSRTTGARESTPPVVILQDRGDRGQVNIPKINAEPDPFAALDRAGDYLDSALRKAGRRRDAEAQAWCWVVIHLMDAVCAALQRREHPDPWFADRRNWALNPAGWAPLDPLARTLAGALSLMPDGEEE